MGELLRDAPRVDIEPEDAGLGGDPERLTRGGLLPTERLGAADGLGVGEGDVGELAAEQVEELRGELPFGIGQEPEAVVGIGLEEPHDRFAGEEAGRDVARIGLKAARGGVVTGKRLTR